MKVGDRVSAFVIDRRRVAAAGIVAGIFAALLGVFGVRKAKGEDPDHDLVLLVSTALDRGQAYWGSHVPDYRPARVVLFEESTAGMCGRALATSGPFYCPSDERIYLDLGFLRAIDGSLARAYVIAHELGHHVEKLTGGLEGSSIEIELGADCIAGAWMRDEQEHSRLESNDLAGALQEAQAVGDDRICPSCSPEQWTHGSAKQRLDAVSGGFSRRHCP